MSDRPILIFIHGWAFDAGVWQRLQPHFHDWEQTTVDLGYTGQPTPWPETGDRGWIAIAHSYGTIRALLRSPDNCHGLISINGFPSFIEKEDYRPAVQSRIFGRMIARMDATEEEFIRDFRQRCGEESPSTRPFDMERLRQDMIHLRDADARDALARFEAPVLQLAATGDIIVRSEMARHAFARAKHLEQRWLEGGDHLLPLNADAWCADSIRQFLDRVVAA